MSIELEARGEDLHCDIAHEELDKLAQILIKIFFEEKCRKTNHKARSCEECDEKSFNPLFRGLTKSLNSD